MIDKFSKKGLVSVGITGEPEAPTKEWLKDTGLKSIVVFEPSHASMRAYGIRGIPSAVLVGPDNKVLWMGHPMQLDDDTVEKFIKEVKPPETMVPALMLPEQYKDITLDATAGKLGQAWKDLVKALDSKSLKDEDRQPLKTALDWVENEINTGLAEADTAYKEKRYYDAQVLWRRFSKDFRGHEAADVAAKRLVELAKNAALKKELEAGKQIAEALEYKEQGKIDNAVSVLKRVLTGVYEETAEAERARKLLTELQKEKGQE